MNGVPKRVQYHIPLLGHFAFPGTGGPSLDSFSSDPLFPDHPLGLLDAGKVASVPVMTGLTRDEGLMITSTIKDGSGMLDKLK